MPEVYFNGPAGRIEGRYNESSDKKSPVVLVLHPHPVYGGTMNNKVVYAMYKTFVENGFTTLRINFRGVGKSQGEFDNGVGELTDAATALDWLQTQNPFATDFWIAGFSFGSWVGMQLMMRRPEITNFLAVSPPVNKYDFTFLSPCPVPGLIVQGNRDSIVSEEAVLDMVDKLSKQKQAPVECKIINGADHFFREKMDELQSTIDDYLKYRLSAAGQEITYDGGLIEDDFDDEDEDDDEPKSGNKPRRIMLDDFL
ncbi:MAG: alpha/beta hydrolase [Rickettsiaceae bacterium]|jgi:alpha/beta superfamily hydrolase|nr:alpha/beta hydrolase [Rickettsiaceae bacterium]